jgi:hypothetical protein
MRNQAKCRLCNDIIESKQGDDGVYCKCGEISFHDNGKRGGCKNPQNFLYIDDEGNEIIADVIQNQEKTAIHPPDSSKPNREELINMLYDMGLRIENLPREAIYSPINHADFYSLIILLSAIFRAEES